VEGASVRALEKDSTVLCVAKNPLANSFLLCSLTKSASVMFAWHLALLFFALIHSNLYERPSGMPEPDTENAQMLHLTTVVLFFFSGWQKTPTV